VSLRRSTIFGVYDEDENDRDNAGWTRETGVVPRRETVFLVIAWVLGPVVGMRRRRALMVKKCRWFDYSFATAVTLQKPSKRKEKKKDFFLFFRFLFCWRVLRSSDFCAKPSVENEKLATISKFLFLCEKREKTMILFIGWHRVPCKLI
jgi:hypothetical protein